MKRRFSPHSHRKPPTTLCFARPGFVLDSGDDLRGFGATGGNVLVDGARPTSKSGGIEDALRRIPASQVLRVEILRGSQSAEAQGQVLVLNIVRAPGASGGAWEVEFERNGDGLLYPRASLSRTQSFAGWDLSLRANAFWEQFPFQTRRITRDGAGDFTATWRDDRPTTLVESFVSGEARRAVAGGVLNLTGRFGWQRFYYDQDSVIFFPANSSSSPDQTNVFAYDRADWNLELGADFTRNFGDWTWKLVGLASGQDYAQEQSDIRRNGAGALVSRSDLTLDQIPIEFVARSTYSRATPGVLRPEFGVEVAFNQLDSALALTVDSGSGRVVVDLPAANVLVEELRAEAFASLDWRLSDALNLETRLAAETSEITVSGDTENAQSFTFYKPSIALVWRLTPRIQVRLGAERTVGQLDFSDFAASAELQDDETVAGNPDLGPDQTTRVAASLDYRSGDDLALNVEFFYEWRQDVLEQVLLPSGGAGLANAGDARFWGMRATLNAPLDFLLPNASLKVDTLISDSEFDDPLTNEIRALTGQRDNPNTTEFLKDFPE
jgi:hypothetical protein